MKKKKKISAEKQKEYAENYKKKRLEMGNNKSNNSKYYSQNFILNCF